MKTILLISVVSVIVLICRQKSGQNDAAESHLKVDEKEQVAQVSQPIFSIKLQFQNTEFEITTVRKEIAKTLTISTKGLSVKEYSESFDITGRWVVNAEVADLNSDGSPELLVYTQSDGSGSYGEVFAFSVNNGKSMSQVYFPPTAENEQIKVGYMGHDEFSVVETRLVQRFPIYKADDSNAKSTGGIRQVFYQLADGEASRRFEVEKVMDLE